MGRLTPALLLLFIATSALAQQQMTAYQALRVVSRQLNRGALNRVVTVTGENGDPQPTQWTVLLADRSAPGGIREVQVANNRIVGNGPPTGGVIGSAQNAMFPAARLNLDSSGAFSVASYTANTSHVNFDSVSYALRTNDRGIPTWIVTLQDNSGASLGKIHINATKGNVARVEGLFRGANMAQGEERAPEPRITQRTERRPRSEEVQSEDEYVDFGENGEVIDESDHVAGDEDENVVKRRIKDMFRRSKRGVERVIERARSSFQDFLDS